MTEKKVEFPELESLYCGTIRAQAITVDWKELIGEYGKDLTVWESAECGECAEVRIMSGLGEDRHKDIDDESECEGFFISDGPMMNYFYPLDVKKLRLGDEATARAIAGLNLCLIHHDSLGYGLALTCGGMDMSDDIAAGYILAGYRPPSYIELPDSAGAGQSRGDKLVAAGLRKSYEIHRDWLLRSIERLDKLEKSWLAEAKKLKKAK